MLKLNQKANSYINSYQGLRSGPDYPDDPEKIKVPG